VAEVRPAAPRHEAREPGARGRRGGGAMAGKKACAHIGRRKAREKSQKKKKVTEERECGEKGMDPVIRRKSLGWPLCGFFFFLPAFSKNALCNFMRILLQCGVKRTSYITSKSNDYVPMRRVNIHVWLFFSALLGKVVSFTYWRESSLFRKHH
jgi:hypothetical protein